MHGKMEERILEVESAETRVRKAFIDINRVRDELSI